MRFRRFELRRHRPEGSTAYFYEIIENTRTHPLAVVIPKHVALVHSEESGSNLVGLLNDQWKEGNIAGMTRFAWWRDSEQFVGTTGTTLKRAIEDFDKEPV